MTGRRDFVFGALLVLSCIGWALHAGKDLNWDLWNYHLYGPHSLLQGRLAQDFMAASIQSYLNPVVHLPLYFMVTAGWHSVLIGTVLAAIHGLALVLLYLICRAPALFPGTDGRLHAMLATLLGAATVIFWSEVGSSFADIITALPVLAALWLFMSGRVAHRPVLLALALGTLFGVAAALKLTNAVYAVAATVLPLALARSVRAGVKIAAAYAAGGMAGVLLGGGYWMGLVWLEFGNPVFPLYNALFASPDFPPVNFYHARFQPASLVDALSAPLRMALPQLRLYSEVLSPDVRVPLLVALAMVVAARRIAAWPSTLGAGASRPVLALSGFYVIGFAGWMATTFNGRYALPILLLTGPLLVAALRTLFQGRLVAVLGVGALALQLGTLYMASSQRWSPYPWTRHWIELDVPKELRNEPYMYLTIEAQPMAAIALFLHPQSALSNVRGQHALDLDGPGGKRLARLLERHRGRVRTLGAASVNEFDGRPSFEWLQIVNTIYGRFGLAVDRDECLEIWPYENRDALASVANRLVGYAIEQKRIRPLLSCALRPAEPQTLERAERQRVDRLFDAIERACPRLFTPGIARSERIGSEWSRFYSTTDRTLVLQENGYIRARIPDSLHFLSLGSASAWEKSAPTGACGK
jgi:hypothetical protein